MNRRFTKIDLSCQPYFEAAVGEAAAVIGLAPAHQSVGEARLAHSHGAQDDDAWAGVSVLVGDMDLCCAADQSSGVQKHCQGQQLAHNIFFCPVLFVLFAAVLLKVCDMPSALTVFYEIRA